MAIMALATVGVALALRDPAQGALEREGDRLAALLEAARAQSRASGMAVRWRPTAEGFSFDGLPPDSTLPTHWLDPSVQALPASVDGQRLPALQLGPEPLIAPQQVQLRVEAPAPHTVVVATDGLRPFTVVSP